MALPYGDQSFDAVLCQFGVMFFPNGVNMEKWTMKEEGALGELSPTLKPMEKVKSEVLVLSELWNQKCDQGDGHP